MQAEESLTTHKAYTNFRKSKSIQLKFPINYLKFRGNYIKQEIYNELHI